MAQKVVLSLDAATEVHDLIEDRPGDADEAALEDARRSLQRPVAQLPSETQELAAAGKVVAMEIDDEAREAIDTLITENTESKPGVLRRLGRRLQGKLASAQHRRSSRSRNSEKTV